MPEQRSPFLAGALAVLYDDPPDRCPACDFDWFGDAAMLTATVRNAPDRFDSLLFGRDAMASPDDGSWNAAAYLWHLVDLIRSWSERFVQLTHAPGSSLVGWDPDELAAARGYWSLPSTAGLWALRDAVSSFLPVLANVGLDTQLAHEDWGPGSVVDGLRWLAHEIHHHGVDVEERAL